MRRVGREFKLLRRLHTFQPARKLPPVAPWWGGEGGNAPTQIPTADRSHPVGMAGSGEHSRKAKGSRLGAAKSSREH